MNGEKNTHLGKKILYALVIFLCGLVLLLSAAGIIGVWVVERPLSDTAVTLLKVVEESTGVVRQSIGRVDQILSGLEARTTEIAESTQQLSQNVTDKGLVMVLLPEGREEQIADTAGSVRDTFTGIRESLARGLELYRTIDSIPLVNLPRPSDERMENLESAVDQTQALGASLRADIADFRSGVAGAIDRVVATVDKLTQVILGAREDVAQLDSDLAALEALSVRLQQVIPGVLLAVAVILSLLFVFVIYTQVEVIRQYLARWRLLGESQEIPREETPVGPAPEDEPDGEPGP